MPEIIPAIMPESYDDLCDKAKLVKGIVPLAQIDIMDGKFVPSKSWPYSSNSGNSGDTHFEKMVAGDERLPYWEELNYEIDLMIQNPEDDLGRWGALGAKRLIFHVESVIDWGKLLNSPLFAKVKGTLGGYEPEIGLAIDTGTPLEKLYKYIDKIDFVQCMGIAKIGYQGEPFDERVLEKISTLREKYPDCIISIDGAVNFKTARSLVSAGANRLVSGSAIFESDDIKQAINKLKDIK